MAASTKTVIEIASILIQELGLHKAVDVVTKLGKVDGNKSFQETLHALELVLRNRLVERK